MAGWDGLLKPPPWKLLRYTWKLPPTRKKYPSCDHHDLCEILVCINKTNSVDHVDPPNQDMFKRQDQTFRRDVFQQWAKFGLLFVRPIWTKVLWVSLALRPPRKKVLAGSRFRRRNGARDPRGSPHGGRNELLGALASCQPWESWGGQREEVGGLVDFLPKLGARSPMSSSVTQMNTKNQPGSGPSVRIS